MLLALGMLFGFAVCFWLVFFKFKWLKLSVPWVLVSAFFVVHVLLIFLIGLRFMTPASNNAKVVQHTIQLVPRLTEPTLVTAVLVGQNQPVKKGQPLFQFDRRPYEYKVQQLEAQLAQAKQHTLVLGADVQVAEQTLARSKSEVAFAKYQLGIAQKLAATGAGASEEVEKWSIQLQVGNARFAWLMGVPGKDCVAIGGVLGERIVLNEFIGYLSLSKMTAQLDPRSFTLATYALCGFANFSSIAIQIGGIGSLAPNRRADLAKLGGRALIGGLLASYLTATVAGVLL